MRPGSDLHRLQHPSRCGTGSGDGPAVAAADEGGEPIAAFAGCVTLGFGYGRERLVVVSRSRDLPEDADRGPRVSLSSTTTESKPITAG